MKTADQGSFHHIQFKGQLQQLLGTLDANFPDLSGRVQIIK
jgi:hypothetical protein